MVHHAGEHTGAAAAYGVRVDPGALQRLPGRLQEQPLLRVHGERLARADPEEVAVELGGVVEESALAGVRVPGLARLRVVEGRQVPAAVGGEGVDAVAALGEEGPQLLGRGDAAGVAAGHGDDGDRLVLVRDGGVDDGRVGRVRADELTLQVTHQRVGVGVVEDEGGGQAQVDRVAEAVAQLHGGQRVEAGLAEGAARVEDHVGAVAEHGGDVGAHQLHEGRVAFGGREGGEAVGEGGGSGGRGRRPAGGRGHQGAQQVRYVGGAAEYGQVQAYGQQERLVGAECGVEQREALVGGDRADAGAGHAGHVGVVEVGGQAGALLPEAPGQGEGGQTEGGAVRGEAVEEGVGGGIAGLARAVEGAGGRGEQHERREAEVLGELVQVPGRVGLGPQHGVEAVGGEAGDEAVVEDARQVDDAGQRAGQAVDERGEAVAVGGVAADDGDVRVEVGEVVVDGAAAAGQDEVAYAVCGGQVAGDEAAEHAGAAGEEHGSFGVEGGCGVVRGGGAGQARDVHGGGAQGELGLGGGRGDGDGRRDRVGVRVGARGGVDEDEPVGVLGLRGAHQAPDGGARQVAYALVVHGNGAVGEHQEAGGGRAVVGEPGAQRVEHAAGGVPGAAEGLGGPGDGQHHPVGHGLQAGDAPLVQDGEVDAGPLRDGQRGPVQAVQVVGADGCREGGRVDGPGDEPLDGSDGRAGRVGEVQGQGVAAGQPYAKGGGPGGVQRDAVPDEGQPGPVLVGRGEAVGVQGGVEERGVQRERVGVRGQFDLGERLVAAAPGGPQALEGGAVRVAEGGEAFVGVVDGQGGGAGGRPGGEVEAGRRGLRGEEALGVQGPGAVGRILGLGVEGERAAPAVVGRRDVQLEANGGAFGQHQRCPQGEFGDVSAAQVVSRAERELHEGGAGQQHGVAHRVVGDPRRGGGAQAAGEQRAAVGDRDGRAEQRVAGGGEPGGGDVAGGRGAAEPVALPLEGVGRQLCDTDREFREHRRPVDRQARHERLAQGGEDALGAAVVAAQRAEPGDVGARGVGGLLDAVQEHGVRAALDEHAVAGVQEGAGGGREEDALAQVGVPVRGVQARGVVRAAGDGGVERHLGGARLDAREVGEEAFANRLDVRAVRGVVDGQALGAVAVGHDRVAQLVQGVGVAGQDDRGGAVDGGHRDTVLVRGDQLAHPGLGQRHGHHAAAAARQVLGDGAAAQGDHAGAVGQGQRARDAGGGDLALGVPDDGGGPHAVGAPHLGERHHDRPQDGLHDVHALQRLAGADRLQEVPVGEGGEGGGAVGHGGGEHRCGVEEFGGHAGPLGALAGEDERDAGLPRPRAAHHVRRGGALGEGREARGEGGQVGAGDDGPLVEGGRGGGERVGDVGDGVGGGGDVVEQLAGAGGQAPLALSGEHQGQRRGEVRRGVAGFGLGGGLHDDVGVGAADPERRHGGAARLFGGGPVAGLAEQLHGAGLPVDLGGGPVGVQGLGEPAVAHRHDHLDDAGDARGGLRVADVGLDRAEPERFGAALAVGVQEGLRLDGVAERRAGAVRLHGVHLGGVQAGVGQRGADDALLGGAVGRGQTVGGAVLVGGGAADQAEDAVAVAAGVGEALQEEHADALAPAGAVGALGEGLAAPVEGQAALAGEVDEGVGRRHHGDAAREGERALSGAQRLHGQVQGDQRG